VGRGSADRAGGASPGADSRPGAFGQSRGGSGPRQGSHSGHTDSPKTTWIQALVAMATVAAPPKYKAKWLGHLALAHHQTALVQGARHWRSRLRSRPLPSGHSPAVPAAQVEPDASLFVFDAADSAFAGQHEGARPWGSVGSAGLPMPELFAAPSAHTQGSIDCRGRTPCIARPACCSTRTTSIWAKRGCQHNAPRQRSAEGLDVTREVCDMQEQAAPRWMRAGSVLVAKPVAEPARASVATMVELPAHYARLFTIFLTI
jgi:hypothetical protein